MRRILSRVGLAPASALAILLIAASPARALTFEEALRIADSETPHIRAHSEAIAGAESERKSAASFPDPRLFVAVENFPVSGADKYSLTDDFMTMRTVGVMQDFPNGDKRGAREAVADAKVAERHNEHLLERLSVKRETASAWIGRYAVERKLALLPELEREIAILAEVVRAQLAGGRASPADSLRVKEEAAALADRRDSLERELAQAKAALVRWVGPRGSEPLAGDPPELPVSDRGLLEQLDQQPELRNFALMSRSALAEVSLAQSMTSSDWSVQFAYQRRAPEFGDMVSLMFTFDLPFFTSTRQEPEIAARLADVRRIESERSAAERQRREELEGILAERAELRRRSERLRNEWMPLSLERVDLTLASYRAGKGDLNAVLDARRSLIETRMNLIELDGEFLRNSARLAYLLPEDEQ